MIIYNSRSFYLVLKHYFQACYSLTDPSSKASLELSTIVIDVENSVELSCDHDNSDPGNPPVIEYIYKNSNGWSHTGSHSYQLEISSVKQETDYSCTGINYPAAYPGGLEGEVSDAKPVRVLGMILWKVDKIYVYFYP